MHIEKAAVSAVAFFVASFRRIIQNSGRICYNNYSSYIIHKWQK